MDVDDCLSRFTLASIKHRIIVIWKNITIEPVILLWALNYGVFHLTSQTLYIDKICKVNLNYTSEICDNIQQHKNEQIKVQEYSSTLKMYNDILQSIPEALYLLMAGSLSDTYGRKPFIAFALLGYVFNTSVFLINAFLFYQLKAEYLLFECLQGK